MQGMINTSLDSISERLGQKQATSDAGITYQTGHWQVHPDRLEVHQQGQVHHLPSKPMQVLCCLLDARGETVSRQQLIDHVWDGNSYVAPKGINNAIWNLRQILNDETLRIETVPKHGYRLVARSTIKRHTIPPESAKAGFLKRYVIPISLLSLSLTVTATIQFLPKEPTEPKLITHTQALMLKTELVFSPTVSPNSQAIAYVGRSNNEQPDIYIYHSDDAKRNKQISDTPSAERAPAWSPNGNQLAYLRLSGPESCELVIKELARDTEKVIDSCHPGAVAALAWSQTSGRIAYIRRLSGGDELIVRNAGLQQIKMTMPLQFEPEIITGLSWSPNGQQLAITDRKPLDESSLLIIDVAAGKVVQQLDKLGIVAGHTWYNEQQIIFASNRSEQYWLWTLDLSTGNITPLLTSSDTVLQPSYQPETRLLAFHQQGMNTVINRITLSDQAVAESADVGQDSYRPTPCGKDQLVFVSNHMGSWQLWLKEPTASKAKPLTPLKWRAFNPSCHAQGQLLAFLGHCHSDETPQLCLLDLATNDTIVLDGTSNITGHLSWDGDSLLFPRQTDDGHEIVRINREGQTIARYPLPFSAGLVRAHPAEKILLFSAPQKDGLWQLNIETGETQRLTIDLQSTQWALWDVAADGLLYGGHDEQQNYLTLQPWNEPNNSTRFPLPSIQFADNGRLTWEAEQNRVWVLGVTGVYTQLRTARLLQ